MTNWRIVWIPLGLLALFFVAWRNAGWQGMLAVGGGVLLWGLLHFTRLMNVMQKAARNPLGKVASAVMLNARLKPGVNLMHVTAMTRALGERLSGEGEQPEIYRWTDGTQSHVTCEFANGRLTRWELKRPPPSEEAPAPGGQS